MKKKQVYEFTDFKSDQCVVQAFKKVSYKNEGNRINCFVSSFPFSGHCEKTEEGDEIPPPIADTLLDQENILSKITGQAREQESERATDKSTTINKEFEKKKDADEQEYAASPFVYLMNKAKYESMLETDVDVDNQQTSYMRMPEQFSVFNKATVFPFETVPNVFKINPPDLEDSD